MRRLILLLLLLSTAGPARATQTPRIRALQTAFRAVHRTNASRMLARYPQLQQLARLSGSDAAEFAKLVQPLTERITPRLIGYVRNLEYLDSIDPRSDGAINPAIEEAREKIAASLAGELVFLNEHHERQTRLEAGVLGQVAHDLPTGDPAVEGIDLTALKSLLTRANDEHSDAVVIMRNGKVVAAEGALNEKIFAMSATKSIASLAIGKLIEEGTIHSLDQHASDFLPEWRQAPRNEITIRMLLNHTSGLDTNGRGAFFALNAPLVFPPGMGFAYNNPAVDLLALVIERASGMKADQYIAAKLFIPLGITDAKWAFKDGSPMTAGELMIRPIDLAKIGQMVLDGGVWKGDRVIKKAWLDLSAAASQSFEITCGLLWWRDAQERSIGLTQQLLEMWKQAGIRPELIEPLRPLVGRTMKDSGELFRAWAEAFAGRPQDQQELRKLLSAKRLNFFEVTELGPIEGFSARGFLGQYLVIDPLRRLIGVRMRRSRPSDYPTPANPNPAYVDAFNGFPAMVHTLAR